MLLLDEWLFLNPNICDAQTRRMKMSKPTCTLIVVAAMLLLSGSVLAPQTVFAQNKVVVIPLFGDGPAPSPSPSVPAPVPKTGQTPTVPLDPAPGGSDGNLQKGVAWPNPRFTDNGNGTVTDNLTNLV
jgi:hypothetical protein